MRFTEAWSLLYSGRVYKKRGNTVKAPTWKKKIVEACIKAGTYQECFDSVIDSLALILQRRDEADEQFIKTGGAPIIKYTNKGGATNPAKNPALILWDDLNKSALAYWRDLGLTPAGLRRINETALSPKKQNSLTEALRSLGSELGTTL